MMQLAGRLAYKRGYGAGARAARNAVERSFSQPEITGAEMMPHGLRVAR